MVVTRAYQTTFTIRLTVVFFFFQSSESNIQGDGVGVNATDSLAQAGRSSGESKFTFIHFSFNQKKLFYKNVFGCLRKGVNLLTTNFFIRRRLLEENSL